MFRLKQWLKTYFGSIIYRKALSHKRKHAIISHIEQFKSNPPQHLPDTAFNVFTYHGEDGILLYLINSLGNIPHVFVDIGAGDCIKSNCAMLAIHFNWSGLFIDADKKQIDVGRAFYYRRRATTNDLQFAVGYASPENINNFLKAFHENEKIGVLSIDIDGNDYWIWEAITAVSPEIVIVEAKVEFGTGNYIVPYSEKNHHSFDQMYNGASVEAIRRLGLRKGYKLVGANKQGYNLFFVKSTAPLPAVSTVDVLTDEATKNSFYPSDFFTQHAFQSFD